MIRTLSALILVALAGGGAIWWGTGGGLAFTSETQRRIEIAAHPRSLPAVALTDSTGARLVLSDYQGAPLLMEFIYTTCPDICVTLGSAFEQIDKAAAANLRLLSISFDPRDQAEQLGWFADRHGAEAPRWRVVRVPDPANLKTLLQQAGVVVVPDAQGGFVHNAGLYLVDGNGRLIQVFDPDDTDGALKALNALGD
ncbi:MAG: SCO family protein [Rhodobacteraceae bacterium]|nr:SCO family protein [Paracoccaceae bacterium]